MNKKVKIPLGIVVALLAILIVIPIASANIWKSTTLSKTNQAADAINDATKTVEEFNAKAQPSSADYDALIPKLNNQQKIVNDARKQAEKVTGFEGLDVTGAYKDAKSTSNKLVGIYDELLKFNTAQLASTEVEKQLIAAFEQSASAAENADSMQVQAQNIRAANAKFQQYLNTTQSSPVEAKTSALLTKLAEALEHTAQALRSNNVAQLRSAERQLQTVISEADSLQAETKAQYAADQQKLQAITDRLNAVSKELE